MEKYKFFFNIQNIRLNKIKKAKICKEYIYGVLQNDNVFVLCIKSMQIQFMQNLNNSIVDILMMENKNLLMSTQSNGLILFDYQKEQQRQILQSFRGIFFKLIYNKNLNMLIGFTTSNIYYIDFEKQQILKQIGYRCNTNLSYFTEDKQKLIVADERGRISIFGLQNNHQENLNFTHQIFKIFKYKNLIYIITKFGKIFLEDTNKEFQIVHSLKCTDIILDANFIEESQSLYLLIKKCLKDYQQIIQLSIENFRLVKKMNLNVNDNLQKFIIINQDTYFVYGRSAFIISNKMNKLTDMYIKQTKDIKKLCQNI